MRGGAPTGSLLNVYVNGELVLRLFASGSMAIARGPVPLQPGCNQIHLQVDGTPATATASLYWVTATCDRIDALWGDRFQANRQVNRVDQAAVLRRLIDLRR